MGGGCSAFKKPVPMIVADLCNSTTDLIAKAKKLVEAPEVGVKEVADFVKSLAGFVDVVSDLLESLDQGNSSRDLVKKVADLTSKVAGLPEGVPLTKNQVLEVIVSSLEVVKGSLKVASDFCSEYKAQLDIAIKALDEVIKELKKQLPPSPQE